MTAEYHKKNDPKASKSGLIGLAEVEIGIINRAEDLKKRGYLVKVSQLVIDLIRIMNLAEQNNIELPNIIKADIRDLSVVYNDRNRLAKNALKKYQDP